MASLSVRFACSVRVETPAPAPLAGGTRVGGDQPSGGAAASLGLSRKPCSPSEEHGNAAPRARARTHARTHHCALRASGGPGGARPRAQHSTGGAEKSQAWLPARGRLQSCCKSRASPQRARTVPEPAVAGRRETGPASGGLSAQARAWRPLSRPPQTRRRAAPGCSATCLRSNRKSHAWGTFGRPPRTSPLTLNTEETHTRAHTHAQAQAHSALRRPRRAGEGGLTGARESEGSLGAPARSPAVGQLCDLEQVTAELLRCKVSLGTAGDGRGNETATAQAGAQAAAPALPEGGRRGSATAVPGGCLRPPRDRALEPREAG